MRERAISTLFIVLKRSANLTQSYGVMANYLYDLDVVEENHELFFKNKIVPISNEIKSIKKKYS